MNAGLMLRDFAADDLVIATQLAEDPEVEQYDGSPIVGGWYREEQEQETWVAELPTQAEPVPIGVVICRLVNRRPLVYAVGIDLLAAFRGMGLGKLVMRRALQRLFVEFGADRVELLVRDYNLRAIRCYQAVGFRHEGLRRQCGQIGDQVYGEQLMGVLRTEYLGPTCDEC